MDILLDIKNRLSLFKNFYDTVRVVDPIKNKVLSNDKDEKICNHIETISNGFLVVDCHDIWKKNSVCKNCISKKAYLNNDTFVKLEHNNGKIFLVIASPIEIEENRYVVEILKDITSNGEIVDMSGEIACLDLNMENIGESIARDYLTGVYNRRYISQRLETEVERSLKRDMPVTVIMADIDFFKKINDTYGHIIGDKILRDFAQTLKLNIRASSDWIGRYGGEEFLIVLNNTDQRVGTIVSEKLRNIIEEKDFIYDGIKINITASFGVYEVAKEEDVSDIIKYADDKLYVAKTTGRNKTAF
ncbi:GGDEF domain-containing protein [Clostridium sp. B9]|uniref:GGDEF domain-containing protein n=1 Tax=Clostridium sp. B9 TaxID=3423224 RepID=UPI003D2EE820